MACGRQSGNVHVADANADAIHVGPLSPGAPQICGILAKVAKKEGLQLPEALATRIAQASERNLRKAILMLEACRVQQYPFTDSQQIELPDWQRYTQQVAANIMAEQSPRRCVPGWAGRERGGVADRGRRVRGRGAARRQAAGGALAALRAPRSLHPAHGRAQGAATWGVAL